MEYSQLRYFSSVAHSGTVRGAAEMLRLSPAAVSKSISILEGELGQQLFLRSGRSLVLTDFGKRFLKRADSLLKDFESLKREVTESAIGKPIRLCTFEVFSTYFLEAIQGLDWKDRSFIVHDMIPGELERAIVEGHGDIGITYLPIPNSELDFVKAGRIEMGVYTKKGAFPRRPQTELPFVVPAIPITGTPTKVKGLDGWPEDAYPRRVQFEVTLMESGLELCRQGLCAGYFPTFVVDAHNRKVKPEFHLERRASPYAGRVCFADVYLVKRRSDQENREFKQLARAIRGISK